MRGNKRKPLQSSQGSNLIVLAGLPRDTFNWIKAKLERDTRLKYARYLGMPSTPHDWRVLYSKKIVAAILRLIENECHALTPHRIIVLYIPSRDAGKLLAALGIVCFPAPMTKEDDDLTSDDSLIAWRHSKESVAEAVYRALGRASKTTNELKAEITDRKTSAYSLPAENFYYPDRQSTIGNIYLELIKREFYSKSLSNELLPSRFTREQLSDKAFKGRQNTDRFFQDCRGRIFPPDLYHAPNRETSESLAGSGLSLTLRQRYRFGVTVRDGNLHYDAQYELPKTFVSEPMYCAIDGNVRVTGSHANVGVNDVVWVPSGRKETTK